MLSVSLEREQMDIWQAMQKLVNICYSEVQY